MSDNLTVHGVSGSDGESFTSSPTFTKFGKSFHQILSDNSTFYNYFKKKTPAAGQLDTGAAKL